MAQKKFKDKYRIPSSRNPYWDYSSPGLYFITICTANRKHYFGEIVNGKMVLTEIGKIAKNEWLKTPIIRPDMNIILDEFCIMPNHFHGIIILNCDKRDAMHCVSTNPIHCVSTKSIYCLSELSYNKSKSHFKPNQFGPQSKNLGSVIRGFKSAVKTYAVKNNIEFAWQSRFHDRIIKNKNELNRIYRRKSGLRKI